MILISNVEEVSNPMDLDTGKLIVSQPVKNSTLFMEREDSLPYSEECATGSYPGQD
jgi:hypothetical protein